MLRLTSMARGAACHTQCFLPIGLQQLASSELGWREAAMARGGAASQSEQEGLRPFSCLCRSRLKTLRRGRNPTGYACVGCLCTKTTELVVTVVMVLKIVVAIVTMLLFTMAARGNDL